MTPQIDLQNTIDSEGIPKLENFQLWVKVTLVEVDYSLDEPEITVRIVSTNESNQLNLSYRGKDKPTNVLSFPFEKPEMIPLEELDNFLGDLVICADVVSREASEQNKPLLAHWAHMVVHGILHLVGFDHQNDKQAAEMEAIEITVLKALNFPNPY